MKFCNNCGKVFRTGMFEDERKTVKSKTATEEEKELCLLYDDICPRCGAPSESLLEWVKYKLSRVGYRKGREK